MPEVNAMRLTTKRTGVQRSLAKTQTTNCSVQLADVVSEINKRIDYLEKQVTRDITQLTSAGAAIAKLAPLSHIIEPSSNLFPDDFVGAGQFIE